MTFSGKSKLSLNGLSINHEFVFLSIYATEFSSVWLLYITLGIKLEVSVRLKLINWKKDLLKESSNTLNNLQKEENVTKPDITDRATEEIERTFELRTRDRERKLIAKIDAALKRVDEGTYGYCEETGDPINIKRLEARPVATFSLEAQETHEKKEKNIFKS